MKKPAYVSLDLGTSYTLMYIGGQGIVYNEPSIIALRISDQKIIAVGIEAAKLIGKSNKNIRVVKPMVDGVITDIKTTQTQLEYIVKRLRIEQTIKGCIMVIAYPSIITSLEKSALEKIAYKLGASFVIMQEEVKMAALGGGVNISAPSGQLVIDSGGGTTDIAVLSSGDVVLSKSIKIAGTVLTKEIQKYVRAQHGMDIGETTAENIKIKIGNLVKVGDLDNLYAYGRDLVSGLPRQVLLTPQEIQEVLKVPVSRIIDLAVQVLESTPPELAGDIFRNGITLCGGTSLIKGMAKYVADTIQLPVKMGDQPLLAVINGTRSFESKAIEIYQNSSSNTNLYDE
ncbi:rod shape-determining protein MreB [Spiroplasma endosymbiont of Aspidapion aeneum]|uniref:rod shape-determining protein MreB n=1 Tax=Spiroplasma endosymbiont of Aspidapion aeneum TaxID=3066276 RepID=UPI00313B35B4